MKYTESPGDFESVEWTGTNQAEVTALVAQYRGPDWQWEVLRDGALSGTFDLDRLLIPPGHWFVVGPMWGEEEPADVPFRVMPAGRASKRFVRKPGAGGTN